MSSNLATFYLSVLVAILFFIVINVFRQVLKTRKMEGSFSKLRKKLTKEAGTAQEYYELASLYTEKKLYSQAVTLYNKAVKAIEKEKDAEEENIALIYNGLGYVYFAQEQYDLALRNYKEALKMAPNYVTALNNLGHAYEKKQLTAQALNAYEDVLKLEPKNVTAKRRAQSLRRLVTA